MRMVRTRRELFPAVWCRAHYCLGCGESSTEPQIQQVARI